jgi:hypothetical protein
MNVKEFESFTRGISIDVVRFNRGEISKEDFYKNMVVKLGKDTFTKTIEILDGDVPK